MSPYHELKFANFLRMCRECKTDGVKDVVVAWPQILGDDYEEIVTNLGLLAAHGLALHIGSPGPNG